MSHSSDLPKNESARLVRIGDLLCEAISISKLKKKQEPPSPENRASTTKVKSCPEELSGEKMILKQIKHYIGQALETTPGQIAKRFNFSRYTAQRHLKVLISQNQISKEGRGKSVRYFLNKNKK